MNICVCVKQVPDTAEIRIDPETNTLIRSGVPSIVNPFDLYALETAFRLREEKDGKIWIISMGPAQAEKAVRACLEMKECLFLAEHLADRIPFQLDIFYQQGYGQ